MNTECATSGDIYCAGKDHWLGKIEFYKLRWAVWKNLKSEVDKLEETDRMWRREQIEGEVWFFFSFS